MDIWGALKDWGEKVMRPICKNLYRLFHLGNGSEPDQPDDGTGGDTGGSDGGTGGTTTPSPYVLRANNDRYLTVLQTMTGSS